jgi:hypothetical protein
MIVYVWSRRNPQVTMNFMGFMNFRAPYLVYVLLGVTVLFNNINALVTDAVGLIIGHLYFYMEDVFPNPPGRRRPHFFKTPRFLYDFPTLRLHFSFLYSPASLLFLSSDAASSHVRTFSLVSMRTRWRRKLPLMLPMLPLPSPL